MVDTGLRPLRQRFSRAWLLGGKRLVQRGRHLLGAEQARRHVFVAGVQRSGTNMMMDVLEKSYETDVYHERDPRAFDNYQMRERPVIHRLAERSPAPVFIIKALCELQDLRTLMAEFPPAQTVWVMRHYEDVVNSMLVSFRNQAKQVRRIVEQRSDGWWLGRGMSDATYQTLCRLAPPELDDANAAALQWYLRNQLFFDQGFDRDPRVLAVKYENLVSDPQRQFRHIFAFLGLNYTPRVAASVFASSVRRRAAPPLWPEVRALCEELDAHIEHVVSRHSGERQ